MTSEEAIKYLKKMKDECNDTFHKVRYVTREEALDMAIKALEQEPCEDKRLYIKVFADLEPDDIAEKIYQICDEDKFPKVIESLKEYFDSEPSVKPQPICEEREKGKCPWYAGDSCLDLDSYEDTREFCDEIKELPPVTPKPKTECSCDQIKWERDTAVAQLKELGYGLGEKPKIGHWKFIQRGKFIDICCSECGYVSVKDYAYNYTIDQLDEQEKKEFFAKSHMNFCECCGVKMSEIPTDSEKE